ncbi:MAG: hypothetical protein A2233_00810 [Candidatus Kerfeldbacteria bacterium RIFOXYA2_FULL_38_24]|uniref:AI-2E family transporter n=1 Tax=Candidatus Kerfeldbacteria bacterium RIFOXYB2_FULL_38_14 TaxID=1798547 RepID=A0A1G2BG10_9BACT|nr:MAG: hypothetical protein A2233_00810 [Candidatus Kerfeldbacteria bacterium RIFOXYA2_FULL_38_24]OGY88094.1 MAG: hypothetical protein A2319_01540 [Candidatus Kerfeldbacteria bacterium RIFOXYB2_FULL_38_14]OGY88451.1 MAG: hypothetical protein A2458_02415 [Candidatus Kerfeldbacteria bacterium RIFOXYC2_FULL_38_9]
MDFKKIQTVAFFALLIGISILFYRLVAPYLFAIFWAAIIASIFYPLYKKLLKKIKSPKLSAGLTLVVAILVVLIPLSFILGLVAKQAVDTYNKFNNPTTLTSLQSYAENFVANNTVQKIIGQVNLQEKIKTVTTTISTNSLSWLKTGSQNTLALLLQAFIMLYSLYYFLKDGDRWLRHLMHLLPFGDNNEAVLYEKFASTGKATLKGTILIGSIQGIFGGILFFIVGIPSAVFWALIMIVMSIIPAVGSFIILYPAALYLIIIGHVWQALVIIIGSVLIGFIDNLLRPPLVGKDMELPPLIIFFATIGGLSVFGISGVVIGPIIAAFFFAVLEMYEHKYKKELDSTKT